MRKTRKGITCQKWNVNTPHRTRYGDRLSLTKTDAYDIYDSKQRMQRVLLGHSINMELMLCPKSKMHSTEMREQLTDRKIQTNY